MKQKVIIFEDYKTYSILKGLERYSSFKSWIKKYSLVYIHGTSSGVKIKN